MGHVNDEQQVDEQCEHPLDGNAVDCWTMEQKWNNWRFPSSTMLTSMQLKGGTGRRPGQTAD